MELNSICANEPISLIHSSHSSNIERNASTLPSSNTTSTFMTSKSSWGAVNNEKMGNNKDSDNRKLTRANEQKCVNILAKEEFIQYQVKKLEASVNAQKKQIAEAMVRIYLFHIHTCMDACMCMHNTTHICNAFENISLSAASKCFTNIHVYIGCPTGEPPRR